MEKADVKKMIHMALVTLLISAQKGTGFSTSPSALTSCDSSTANIYFNFSIDATEIIFGKRIWFFGADKIAESDGTTLTPVPSYSSRLTAYGTSGISLSNVTVADAGTYTNVIVLLPTASPFTATTALLVQVAPLAPPSGCQVNATQSNNILTCAVNTDSGNCGTPSLNAFWVNSTNTSNQFQCNIGETYQCCATSAALTCYSGRTNDFCKLITCTAERTTTTNSTPFQLGLGLGLGLGIPCIITCIVLVIFIYTGYKFAYTLGLVLGLGLDITFIVGCIIIASLLSTGNECKLELGLGLGLGLGMPDVIASIIAVTFTFFSLSIFKAIPNRVELGKGILTGLLVPSVIGIIVVYLKYDKLKREPTCTTQEHKPPEPSDEKTEEVQLEPIHKKDKTNNPGPLAVHTRTQNKVEPDTISNQTNDRQQPVRPIRPQPPPPQNGESKDRNLRGISANLEDTLGLANETPRHNKNKLPPLTAKQEAVQEEDVSEEPKKKRKKKKKKDQINEETPEDENGGTIQRVN